jgi:hypothetical protein
MNFAYRSNLTESKVDIPLVCAAKILPPDNSRSFVDIGIDSTGKSIDDRGYAHGAIATSFTRVILACGASF